jgi:predicted amidohydrolase
MSICVAGIQMAVTNDVGRNAESISRAIGEARGAGAGILLTPEGALSGYRPDFEVADVEQALEQVTSLAREQGVGLALGTCFKEADGLTHDELRFYMPDGVYLGRHDKTLRCGTLTNPSVGEIQHYATSSLRVFTFCGVVIGGLVCNDMWANPECTPMPDPQLSRQLSSMGARIIFHAVNGGRDESPWSREVVWNFHDSNLRMRARAGRVHIVTVDSSFPAHLPCAAPGGVVDPQGEWVCRTHPKGEEFFVHTIEL